VQVHNNMCICICVCECVCVHMCVCICVSVYVVCEYRLCGMFKHVVYLNVHVSAFMLPFTFHGFLYAHAIFLFR